MKTILLLAFCGLSLNSIAQVSIRDTFERYTGQYEAGLLNMRQLDSVMSAFFGTLPYDDPINHYEKEFKRYMYFMKDRVYINELGEENTGIYTTSLIEYLNDPICPNGDAAHWKFNFDPSPIHEKPSYCAPVGAHGSGIVRSVYMNPANPNIILAGSGASGIWYTEDGGENWTCVTENLRVPALGIEEIIDISNPSEPVGKYLIAITGKDKFNDSFGAGILKSNDYGKTWTRYGAFEVGGTIEHIIDITKPVGETNKLYAISRSNVFMSSDRGITWSLTDQPPGFTELEYLHSISASNISSDIIYLSSKLRWDVGQAHFWISELSEPTLLWQDQTDEALAPVKNLHNINIDTTEFFSGTYNLMTPHFGYSRVWPSGDTTATFDLEFEMYEGSMHLKSFPVIYSVAAEDPQAYFATQQRLSLELDKDIPTSGDYLISFDAKIPYGAKIKFYQNEDFLIDTVGTDGLYRSYTLPITLSGSMDYGNLFEVKFAYEGAYDLDAADTLYMDDLRINIVRDQPLRAKVIDLANPNLNEEYVLLNVLDDSLKIGNLYMLHSSNKAEDFELMYYEPNKNLGLTRNFTAGYGTEKGLYYGGAQFQGFNFETNIFFNLCTKHADIRDIQIVKNVGGVNQILVGDDGGLSFSDDGGFSWVSLNGSSLPITEFYGIGLNPNDHKSIIGGTQDNGTFLGQHPEWHHIGAGDGGHAGFSPSSEHPDLFYYQVNERIYADTNWEDGGSFYSFNTGSNKIAWFLGEPIEIDPVEGFTLYSGHKPKVYADTADQLYFGGVIVKHNLGDDSFTVHDFGGNTQGIGAIEIAPANTDWIYAATEENRSSTSFEKLFLSTNGGDSYTDQTLASTTPIINELGNPSIGKTLNQVLDYKNINSIETDPNNELRLWIGLSGLHKRDGEVFEGELRVLRSNNGGITWYDFSKGLPPFPINDLIYQEGSNDRLFAATDAGVFYRDASMDEWVCFQEGMPVTFITDLEINYCTQELFAATYGRGIWKSTIDLPDSEPIVISENTTWSGLAEPAHDIIIEAGNTLTITGLVKMAGAKRIKVKQGAQLVVDGGTITRNCEAFWGGIEVWGNKDENQTPSSNQGVITLKNGATIEHAEVAVTLWERGDYEATGGIILASSSTFKNNKKDVEFRTYQNRNLAGVPIPNKSFFSNVTFTWDDDFMAEFPLGHITLYQVDGIQFKGCTFADDRTDPTSRYLLNSGVGNSGIYSIDAQYYVAPICTDLGGCTGGLDDADWSPNTFRNLDFGVYASNVNSEHNILVDRAVFENNFVGTQMVNVNSPVITRSQFTVNDSPDNNFLDTEQYGVHAIRSKGLKVEENEFTHLVGSNTVYGLVCTDLGESEEQIYNNRFEALDFGIATQGKNRDASGFYGLQFLCDSNVANQRDHLVLGSLWFDSSPEYGVRAFNGHNTKPSGNIFSLMPATAGHYDNNSENLVGYYYRLTDVPETPEEYEGLFERIGVASENTCPSQLTDNPFQEQATTNFKTEFVLAASDLADKQEAFQSLVNGGNTDSLMTEIDNLIVENREQLRSLLNSYSPYLTVDVVKATIDNPITKYPHAWSYELIVDNIEVAYEFGFMDFLSTKTYPLPTWMIDDIQAKVDSGLTTDMTVKQLEIADLSSQKAYNANVILQSLKNDTLSTNVDSIRHWIQLKGDILAQTRIIDSYLQEGDFVAAQTNVDALALDIQNYPVHLQDELTDFVDFKDKIIAILSAGNDFDNLNETDHNFMTDMATGGTGLARYQAQELLCFFYDECFNYSPIIPAGIQSPVSVFGKEKDEQEKRNFAVYPNPANNWVTIVLPESELDMNVTIVDLTGRIVFKQTINRSVFIWDTESIGNGTYLISVTDQMNTESFGTEKVTVQH